MDRRAGVVPQGPHVVPLRRSAGLLRQPPLTLPPLTLRTIAPVLQTPLVYSALIPLHAVVPTPYHPLVLPTPPNSAAHISSRLHNATLLKAVVENWVQVQAQPLFAVLQAQRAALQASLVSTRAALPPTFAVELVNKTAGAALKALPVVPLFSHSARLLLPLLRQQPHTPPPPLRQTTAVVPQTPLEYSVLKPLNAVVKAP